MPPFIYTVFLLSLQGRGPNSAVSGSPREPELKGPERTASLGTQTETASRIAS